MLNCVRPSQAKPHLSAGAVEPASPPREAVARPWRTCFGAGGGSGKPVSEVPIRPPASKREWRDDFDDRHDQSVWRGRLASVRPRVLRFRATKYYVKGIA